MTEEREPTIATLTQDLAEARAALETERSDFASFREHHRATEQSLDSARAALAAREQEVRDQAESLDAYEEDGYRLHDVVCSWTVRAEAAEAKVEELRAALEQERTENADVRAEIKGRDIRLGAADRVIEDLEAKVEALEGVLRQVREWIDPVKAFACQDFDFDGIHAIEDDHDDAKHALDQLDRLLTLPDPVKEPTNG